MEVSAAAVLEVAVAVQELAAAHQRVAMQALSRVGVDATSTGLMWVLAAEREPVGMSVLASRLGCDPSNVTVLCRHLRSKGLIEQHADHADGRRRTVILTSDGRDVADVMIDAVATSSPLVNLDPRGLSSLGDLLLAAFLSPPA